MATWFAFDASDESYDVAIDMCGPHGVVIYTSNEGPSACLMMVPILVWGD